MTNRLPIKFIWFLTVGIFTAFAFIQLHPVAAFFFWLCLFITLYFIIVYTS